MFSNLWILPFYILLLAGVLLPSDGSHSVISLKSLGFIGTALSLILHLALHPKMEARQFKLLGIFLFFVCFLGVWTLWSDLHQAAPVQSQLDQFKIFLITGFVLMAGVYYVNARCTDAQTIFKVAIYGNFTYSIIKVLLVAGHVMGVVNLFDILAMLGVRFMSMEIMGDFSRLQTSVDILTPYLLYFVFQSEKLGLQFPKGFKSIYCVVAALSIALSFSRFLIFAGCISYLLYVLTLKGKKLAIAGGVGLALLLAGITAVGWENTALLVQKRFFGSETSVSDQIREQQIEDVMVEFEQQPLMGKGMGTYSHRNVRDADLKYSYEVQWVAFLMQFGVIGVALMLIPICWMAGQFIVPPITIVNLSFMALFLLWILSGFTNPFLISLTSGIVYLLFYLAPKSLAVHKSIRCVHL